MNSGEAPERRVVKRWESASAQAVLMTADRGCVMHRQACPDTQFWLVLHGDWIDRRSGRPTRIQRREPVRYNPGEQSEREASNATTSIGLQLLSRPADSCWRYETPSWLADRVGEVSWEARRVLWRIAMRMATSKLDDPLELEELVTGMIGVPTRETSVPAWLRRVRDSIHDSQAENVPLAQLAAIGGVTPAHLSAAFRKAFGSTLSAYRRRLRVQLAVQKMEPGTSAGIEAGFFDEPHFYHACKRELSVTPGELARALRQ